MTTKHKTGGLLEQTRDIAKVPPRLLKRANKNQLRLGLAWFSIGLGLTELLAPTPLARTIGVSSRARGLIRIFGLREITHGLTLFSQTHLPAKALWYRVAGDALDLAALTAAFVFPGSNKTRLAFATTNVLTVALIDIFSAWQFSEKKGSLTSTGGGRCEKTLFINRQPSDVYKRWRDFESHPQFMQHLSSVRELPQGKSHWIAKGPIDTTVEWDAELTDDVPGELIAWRSLPGSPLQTSGVVTFHSAPGGGTYLRVEMDYSLPGGLLGTGAARLLGADPSLHLESDLRRFKQIVEIGEIVRSEGNPQGTGHIKQFPAQPHQLSVSKAANQ